MMLKVSEIFYSLQGETSRMGLPTVFIRLTGCPLRCVYCDTAYAFYGGDKRSISEILTQIAPFDTPYITVTGGEPLAQKSCLDLLTALCDKHYSVSLETSGALDIQAVDKRVSIILDIKTPASEESQRMNWQNLQYLKAQDEIKFVLCNRQDYDWAKQILATHTLNCPVLFSPSYAQLDATTLADWILADQLSVRMQIQLHKLLWNDARGK